MVRVRNIGRLLLIAGVLTLGSGGCNSLPSPVSSVAAPFADASAILSSEPSSASPTSPPSALIPPAPSAPSAEPKAAEMAPTEPPKLPEVATEVIPEESKKVDVRLRGRIESDADFVRQSARDQAIVGMVNDATGFRRARLGAEGNFGEQISFVAEFDFAGGEIAFKDVWGQIGELPYIGRIRLGHMLEPFSLEGQTSSNYFTFMERSQIMSLDPARNWGVETLSCTENERATLRTGVFRSGSSNSSGDDPSGQNDLAYDARATWLPWYDDWDGLRLWHVGTAFSQRKPANNVVVINSGPQSSLLSTTDNPDSPFTSTITIPASQQQLYNFQSALVLGSLSFQAEWTGTHIQQIGGGPVFLDGCYGYVSWFVTGENRGYDKQDGTFGATKVLSPFVCLSPKKLALVGTGAWELVARLAYSDFANANIPPANGLKVGDKEAVVTLGVNWYLTDNFRFMFNWVHAIPVDPNFGPSYADVFMLRTAIYW
jgi:phosphate-selective porin OprO and OprP